MAAIFARVVTIDMTLSGVESAFRGLDEAFFLLNATGRLSDAHRCRLKYARMRTCCRLQSVR